MSLINKMEQLAARDAEIAKLRAIVVSGARVLTESGLPTTVQFGEMGSARTRRSPTKRRPNTKGSAASTSRGLGQAGGGSGRVVRKAKKRNDGSYEFYDEMEYYDDFELRDEYEEEGDDDATPGVIDPSLLDAAAQFGIR